MSLALSVAVIPAFLFLYRERKGAVMSLTQMTSGMSLTRTRIGNVLSLPEHVLMGTTGINLIKASGGACIRSPNQTVHCCLAGHMMASNQST